VTAFLTAVRAGDFDGLVAVLDPDVVIRIDEAAAVPGTPREIRGARNWAKGAISFSRGARLVEPMVVDGTVGLIFAPRGRLLRVLQFTFERGKIAEVNIVGDPTHLRKFNLAVLEK
jgi:RNA polymerase sigma-70 factor (ECF subfamily)